MLVDATVAPILPAAHLSLGDTGVTAFVAADPRGMRAAVDVRGGGPGTRETDLLAPHNTVERVHAILLCGGSAFGLAAADGAMRELESRGRGFPVFGEGVPGPRVPIVPAAVIFDLAVGDPSHRPTASDGAAAVAAALEDTAGEPLASGSVGAGCGATAGVLRGGFGIASRAVELPGARRSATVTAAVVANPVGSAVDPATGLLFGDASKPAVDLERYRTLQRPAPGSAAPDPRLNTTIGVVATDVDLPVPQLQRLAMTGHDGIARAIRPAHSPLDGDTLFAVSVPKDDGQDAGGQGDAAEPLAPEALAHLCGAAADAVEAAIVDAVCSATGGFGVTAWSDVVVGGRR